MWVGPNNNLPKEETRSEFEIRAFQFIDQFVSEDPEVLPQSEPIAAQVQPPPSDFSQDQQQNARDFARFWSFCRAIRSNLDPLIMANQLTHQTTEIGIELACQLSNKKVSVYQVADTVHKIFFSTPLFLLVRKNKTICELGLAWVAFRTIKSLFFSDKKDRTPSMGMKVAMSILQYYGTYNFNRCPNIDQWADRDYYSRLISVSGFVNFFLPDCRPPAIESHPFQVPKEAFIRRLKAQHFPIDQNLFQTNLQNLLNRGIDDSKLLELDAIPVELFQDRHLKKYLCSITGQPVRYPVLICKENEIKLCERASLERHFGPISQLYPDRLRPQQNIPGLNCLPSQILIVSRLELELLEDIETRLRKICKQLARLRSMNNPTIDSNNQTIRANGLVLRLAETAPNNLLTTIRQYGEAASSHLITRIERNIHHLETLTERVDQIAASILRSENSYYNIFSNLLASLPVLVCYGVAKTATALENLVIEKVCVHLLGTDEEKIKALHP